MCKALYPKDSIVKKKGERVFTSIEEGMDASIWWFKDYIKKQKKTY